jgi:hypothetical protein
VKLPLAWAVTAVFVAAPIVAAAIERTCVRLAVSHKALAIDLRISESQLSRELSGDGHIAFDRFDRMSVEFKQALIEELARVWGCERPLTARDVVELIRPVMARMAPAAHQSSATREESCA